MKTDLQLLEDHHHAAAVAMKEIGDAYSALVVAWKKNVPIVMGLIGALETYMAVTADRQAEATGAASD